MLRTLDNTLGLDDIRRETGLSSARAAGHSLADRHDAASHCWRMA